MDFLRPPPQLSRRFGRRSPNPFTAAANPTVGLIEHLVAEGQSYADGDPVTDWIATVGTDASQSGSARPTFKAGIINGKAVIRFNGTSQWLSWAGAGADLTSYTMMFVFAPNTVSSDRNLFSQDVVGFSNDFLFGLDPENLHTGHAVQVTQQKSSGSVRYETIDPSGSPSSSSAYLFAVRNTGSALELYRTDPSAPVATTAVTGTSITDRTWGIGASPAPNRFFSGDLAELKVWNLPVSAAVLTSEMNDLVSDYNITT